VSRVERHYRRLVRLLPAEARAARGEEFLGLLLDMEDERSWPSVQETAALLWLAVLMHLRRPAIARIGIGLLSACLIVGATEPVAPVIPALLFKGAGRYFIASGSLPESAYEIVSLSAAIAWALGAYRTTLALFTAAAADSIFTAYTTYVPSTGTWLYRFTLGNPGEFVWYVVSCIGVPIALAVVAWRKPARRPVSVGFACIAIAIVMQDLTNPFWSPDMRFFIFNAAWILGIACAATVALYALRSAWSVLIALVVAGFVAGVALYTVVPSLLFLYLVVTLFAGKAAQLIAAQRRKGQRHTPATADGIA
jgi:hypothetical protein